MRKDLPQQISKEIRDKFSVENNTLKRDVKENPNDRITVEIGDSKQPDFKPQAKIMRWDNEVNFSLRAEEHPDAVVETEGNLIKYITPEYEVHQYELDPGDIGEDGGLEFEWILPQKPSTNVLRGTLQTKGLNFFYQPPLTEQEIAEGTERPENVVGSYAVYHATKGRMNRADGMEYKVGKAFHIYRPKVTDAKGNEIWGELNIDEQNGLLTVTIDQAWLDNAIYPVIVDPTFGYTSIGGTSVGVTTDTRPVSLTNLNPGEAGTLDNISYYSKISSGSGTQPSRGKYYLVSDKTFQGKGDEQTITTTPQWYVSVFASPPSISAIDYYLAFHANSTSTDRANYYYDSATDALAVTSATYDSDANLGTLSPLARIGSIYATYTAAGGEITPTDKFFHFFPLGR